MNIAETVIAGMGIAGTLAGVYFGYRGTLRSVELQQEHENRSRFQEQRLNAFVDFLDAVSTILAVARLPRPLHSSHMSDFLEGLTKFNMSYKRIGLCAGADVRTATDNLHRLVWPLTADNPAVDVEEQMKAVLQAQIKLEHAMRGDLNFETVAVSENGSGK